MQRPDLTVRVRRKQIQDAAAEMGIDDAYISVLVDTFYQRIRAHPALGPIFNDVIGDDWDLHLSKMKDFWASVAFNAGRYSGKPVPAHTKLADVTPEDFTLWLALFEETLVETAPSEQAVAYFMERANRIASSLQKAMYGTADRPC